MNSSRNRLTCCGFLDIGINVVGGWAALYLLFSG